MLQRLLIATLMIATAWLAAPGAAQAERITVGSTNFSEQLILAHIYAQVLEHHGFDVRRRLNLGSREIVYPALLAGEIDLLPEYSGALLAHVTRGEHPATAPDDVIDALREALPEELTLLTAAPAENKDALVVTAETAERYGLSRISDLADVADSMIIGGPPEMRQRRNGLPGLREVYGLNFQRFRALDAGGPVTTAALTNGDIDVARMFTTQGVIVARGWVILEDDRGLTPAQNIVPLIRRAAAKDRVAAALDPISMVLTTETLQRLNETVSIERQDPAAVARQWLSESGLLD
jgi:osmoprotectant transport system substrate-binding protein